MIQDIDIEIYKCISEEMDVAEIYLGHIPFAFHYTKAQFTATCTEAIPFNPFDKVICELLKVEESLSLEEIGDILGMNVYESANPKRYLDIAEKEILTESLQSLSSPEFGRMIEGGDINFSSCRLTPTGREYAEKKCKFRTTVNKPFTIYFDQTTGNHKQAKQVFEFVDGKLSGRQFEINSIKEAELKEIAFVQVPEIYNPEKQYSFTDAVLQHQKNLSIEYPIAITYNVKDKNYHYYCYDTANNRIHKGLNDWINAEEDIKNSLLSDISAFSNAPSSTAIDLSELFINQLENESGIKLITEKSSLLKSEYVDELLFISFLNEVFKSDEKIELFLCLPYVTKHIYLSLAAIIQQTENTDSRFFFIFPNNLNEEIQQSFEQLQEISGKVANLYVLQLSVKSLFIISKTDTNSFYFEIINGTVNSIKKSFIQRKKCDSRAEKTEQLFLEKFSDEYSLKICSDIITLINEDIQENVAKEQIEELDCYQQKLASFKRIGKYVTTVEMTLNLIETFKKERIVKLKEQLNLQLDEVELKMKNVNTENQLNEINKAFEKINSEIIHDTLEANSKSQRIKKLIEAKKSEFEEAKRIYSFIIDTNVFIKDSDIISKVPQKNKIIIAAKVIDELDKFKTNPQLKDVAVKCIKTISKGKNIHRAKANMKLLPVDFSKKSPDNIILATALMYKERSGILITDDTGLQEKAKTVEMVVMSYDEFLTKFIK